MAVNLSFIGGAGWQFFNNNGVPLAGGKIYTYAAGTSTPQTTYTSRSGLTANTNPIILDAAGRTPEQIWSTEGLLYKYVVMDASNVVIRTWDNIGGSVVASDLEQNLSNTTDNSKGDALIGFKQSTASGFLTNAVARTVNDKLQETISVKDYGAVGNGITDDTVAIQTAIVALAQRGGKLDFPNATYLITNTLVLPFGNNARDKVFVLEFNGSEIKSNVFAPTGSTYTGFISGYLDGATAVASVTGTEAHVAANVVIQNVHLTGFGTAIRLHNFNYGCAIQNVYATACFNGIHLSRCFYLVVNNAFLTGRGRTVGGVGFKTEAFSNILPLSGIKTNQYDIGMQLGGFDGGKIESSSAEICNIGVDLNTESSVLYVDTIYLEGNDTVNLRISANVRRLLLTNSWFYGDSNKHVTCTLNGTSFANMTVISTSFQNGITNSPPISNVFGDVLNYGADPITPPAFSGLPNLRAISPRYEIDTVAFGYNGAVRSLDNRYYNGLIPTAYGGRFRNGVSSANNTPYQTSVDNLGSFEFTTEYNADGFTALLWSVSIAFATGTYRRTFLVFYDNSFEVWRLYEPGPSGLTLETSATCTVVNGFLRLKAPTLTGPSVNYSLVRPL